MPVRICIACIREGWDRCRICDAPVLLTQGFPLDVPQ